MASSPIRVEGIATATEVSTIGIVYAFVSYLARVTEPLIQLTMQFSQLQQAVISAARVNALLDEAEANRLMALELPLPTYEMVVKASHTFNLLDARRAISVTERQGYILRVRTLARAVARAYFDARLALGFPLAPPELAAVVCEQAVGARS